MAVKLFKALRHELMEAEISMEQLARRIGMDGAMLSRRFCGRTDWSLKEMYAVMHELNLNVNDMPFYFPESGKNNELLISKRGKNNV